MLTPVPPTDCMIAREGASARLDGELPELDALRLDAHLASCAACADFAASIGGATTALRVAPLEALPEAPFFTPRRRGRRPHLVAVAAASLVVAVAAGSSFFLGQQLGGRAASTPPLVRATTAAAGPQIDPGLLAMLRNERGWLNPNRRAIAL